jgi:hypothetical protein
MERRHSNAGAVAQERRVEKILQSYPLSNKRIRQLRKHCGADTRKLSEILSTISNVARNEQLVRERHQKRLTLH